MRTATRRTSLAVVAAVALALTACGGDDGDGEETGSEAGGETGGEEATGGEFSSYIGEPENPLIPGTTSETEGGQIVDSVFTGLVQYNIDTYEAEFTGVAESIESDDQQTWTVKLNDGWTFHDGTPVTAQSFVNAWNWNAYGPNAADNSYFFANIEGYQDLQGEIEVDEETGEVTVVEEPASEEMSGLQVVDDLTFTVTLTAPFSIFPMTTGYTAFFPLPDAFFDDPEAAGRQPIGNGPWKATGEFVPGEGITLERFEEYAGGNTAKADRVELRVYVDENTGYSDVQAGNLDISDTLPVSALTTGPDEFGDRWVEGPRGDITALAFPIYDERYSDPRVRQAIAMGINRQAIVDAIYLGSRQPANSWASPVAEGYREDVCEFNNFDAERANQLLDEAGFDRSEPVDLWFNSGAGHDEWVEAIGNELRTNLGIEDYNLESLDFAEFLPLRDEKGMTGPYRHGWVQDYPHIQNFLEPLYSEAAQPPLGSNDMYYTNPDFDAALAEANASADPEEALTLYHQAEDMLCQDMPSTPLWYGIQQVVHSERVSNVYQDA